MSGEYGRAADGGRAGAAGNSTGSAADSGQAPDGRAGAGRTAGGARLRGAGVRGAGPQRPLPPVLRWLIRWGRRPLLPALRLWRRNIQLRVVATTMLMSLGVVLLLGFVVVGQVRNGLLEAKRQAAQSQAIRGFAVARQLAAQSATSGAASGRGVTGGSASGSARDEDDTGQWLTNLVEQLASGGQGAYEVITLSSNAQQQPSRLSGGATRGPRAAPLNVQPEESVPGALRDAVDDGTSIQEAYTSLILQGDEQPQREAALAIGQRLTDPSGHAYQLYYVFPFTQEEKTLGLVEGTLATAGIFVVALLCAIAWLVVRQVVTPVRMAASIAERLAAGLLQERMKVAGEDDIARLGESFNKMAHTLQTKIQQLEELSRMQRRFVSDVSHELRTPLTTVRMAADVIHEAREDFDPVTARSAELLGSQLDRFESLLSDLLEISRFDAGAADLSAEPIDLRDVVRRVVEGAEPLSERKGTRVRVVGDEQPVIAEADARRVERVLRNLVVNAVEHGEGRDVVVRLATAGGAVAVAVRDYGVGLKPGEATRVFNRFWRADPARARTTGGTGLGLSIAVEDARLHGGWLQAWGEPGGGSQFRLTLPRTAGEALRGSPIPLEPADSRRNRAALANGGRRGGSGSHRVAGGGTQGQATSGGAGRAGTLPPVPAGPPRPPAADPAALPGSGARVVATPPRGGHSGRGPRPGSSGTGAAGAGETGGAGGGGTVGGGTGGASRADDRGEGGSGGTPRGRREDAE
jgi:two-component system sensor histidine kinase MtrB